MKEYLKTLKLKVEELYLILERLGNESKLSKDKNEVSKQKELIKERISYLKERLNKLKYDN